MTTPKQKAIDEKLGEKIWKDLLSMETKTLKKLARDRMTKLRLDDLEAKAKAAESWDWYSKTSLEDDLGDLSADFIASMSPQTALALIRIARAAKNAINGGCIMYGTNRGNELKEALEVI